MPHIQVFSEVPARDGELGRPAAAAGRVEFPAPFALVLTEARPGAAQAGRARWGPSTWTSSKGLAHRRKFGGARPVHRQGGGVEVGAMPTVVDATAGLGRDAFVLASLGCRVTLIERSPVVAALLQDGLARAGQDPGDRPWVRERMHLLHGPAVGDPCWR